MNWKKTALNALSVLVMLAVLAGCNSPAPTTVATTAPTIDVQPTIKAAQTQAVQTLVAGLTQNAPTATVAQPTNTLGPTQTQGPTNTPLPPTATATSVRPTVTYIAPTLTLQPYSCTVSKVSPKDTEKITKGSSFDVSWTVKNTGSMTWLKAEVDLRYSSGTKMQKYGDLFDTTADVPSGGTYTAVVDMKAPATAGTYEAVWITAMGNTTICTLNVKVTVVN